MTRTTAAFCRATVTLAIALAGTTNAQEGMPQFPPAQVEVAVAEVRDMAPVVDVSGTVVSLNDSRIATEVEGVLSWLIDVGDAVDAGDVVARIDPRLMRIAVSRAEADVARLTSDYDYRQRQLERTEELATRQSASATLLDESRALRDQAQHALTDAKAALERARGDLERATIRAPFAGHIVDRLASIGEYLAVGEDVVRLVDTHRKEISLPAPIALTEFVRPGISVPVRSGETLHEQPVRAVVPVGDAVSRMVEIRLEATESDLLVGTAVTVSLPNAAAVRTVAVPRDALVERGSQASIYRVNAEGVAERVDAEIGPVVGLWVGIRSGIDEGDRVIVRGAERLAPGQPVAVNEP